MRIDKQYILALMIGAAALLSGCNDNSTNLQDDTGGTEVSPNNSSTSDNQSPPPANSSSSTSDSSSDNPSSSDEPTSNSSDSSEEDTIEPTPVCEGEECIELTDGTKVNRAVPHPIPTSTNDEFPPQPPVI